MPSRRLRMLEKRTRFLCNRLQPRSHGCNPLADLHQPTRIYPSAVRYLGARSLETENPPAVPNRCPYIPGATGRSHSGIGRGLPALASVLHSHAVTPAARTLSAFGHGLPAVVSGVIRLAFV